MVDVERFNHVVITARDFNAALDFYANILQLPQLPRPDHIGRPGAWFQVGQNNRLYVVEEAPEGQESHRHISMEAVDFEAVVDHLRSKGVKMYREPGTYASGLKELRLLDPGGNFIEIVKEPENRVEQASSMATVQR